MTDYFDTVDLRLRDRGITLGHHAPGWPGGGGTWLLALPGEEPGAFAEDRAPDQPPDHRDVHRADHRDVHRADQDVPARVQGLLRGVVRREPLGPRAEIRVACRPVPDAAPTGHPPRGKAGALAEVVRWRLATHLGGILDHDWRLRWSLPEPSPHAVHQARVAARRLRSDLKTFAPVLDPVWTQHVRRDLRWLGTALGEVRDADVLGSRLTDLPPELAVALADQRALAVRQLAVVLDTSRYLDLLDRLHAATVAPPFLGGGKDLGPASSPADALPALVGSAWHTLERRVHEADTPPTDRQLHRIRIGAKQVRYAAEAAAPVVGRPARRAAHAAEKVQGLLGEHHDAVAAEGWLRARAVPDGAPDHRPVPPLAPGAAFAAGRLAAGEHRRQCELREAWPSAWHRLAKGTRTRWLA